MKRGELKNIYDKLSNSEKKAWASKSNYTSYEGLYRYLKNNQQTEAYERVFNGLVSTIGQQRLDQLISNSGVEMKNATEPTDFYGFAKKIVEIVFNSNNVEQIESIKKNFGSVVSACDNQLERIKINSEILK